MEPGERDADRVRAAQLLATGDEEIVAEAIAAAEAADRWPRVVAVRRLQLERRRDAGTLTRLGSALCRAGELAEAETVLAQARSLDATYLPAATAWAALLRARGEWAAARRELEALHRAAPADAGVAGALAAVEIDDAERLGDVRHLDAAEQLLTLVDAQQPAGRETRALYGRLDALRRRLSPGPAIQRAAGERRRRGGP